MNIDQELKLACEITRKTHLPVAISRKAADFAVSWMEATNAEEYALIETQGLTVIWFGFALEA